MAILRRPSSACRIIGVTPRQEPMSALACWCSIVNLDDSQGDVDSRHVPGRRLFATLSGTRGAFRQRRLSSWRADSTPSNDWLALVPLVALSFCKIIRSHSLPIDSRVPSRRHGDRLIVKAIN